MPNELPLNWCECKFEDVLDYEQPTRYIVSNTDYQEQGIAVLTAGKSFILGYTDEKDGIFDASKETVIIFDDFTTASKLVDFPFKVKSSAMKILHAKKDININFLYYLMQTIHYESDTHKRYWISEYAKQTISLPPLAEQERIVEKIEALFAGIDEGVERLKSAQAQIKQYRQSVLKSAFEGKLYKTTEWKEVKLSNIADALGGYAFKSEKFSDVGYQIIRMGNIKPLTLNLEEKSVYIKDIDDKIKDKYLLQPNDIVITLTGTRKKRDYGYVVLIKDNSNLLLNQRLARLRPNDKVNAEYLAYALQSEPYQTQFFLYETGNVGQGNVSMKALTDESILLPSLPEQQHIVAEIENRFAVADELEKAVNEGLEKADKLKQSILKKAFEGKLAPQNPNDEPASVLLERIKKSQTPTKGKKK